MTEHKRAEEARLDAQNKLAHAKSRHDDGAAHGLNCPRSEPAHRRDGHQCAGGAALAGPPAPDLGEARQALARIVKDGCRAAEVIGRIRALIKKRSGEVRDMNGTGRPNRSDVCGATIRRSTTELGQHGPGELDRTTD
jgi:hypothetical protein